MIMDGVVDKLGAISSAPLKFARKWKTGKKGRRVVGHLCSYSPDEIIAAAGALPFRMLGSGMEIGRADKHIQSYTCDVLRSILESDLTGEYEGLMDLVVFPHTCDSVQCLTDIWSEVSGANSSLSMYMPVNLKSRAAPDMIEKELKTFRQVLEARLDTKITDEALDSAIEQRKEAAGLLKRIYFAKVRKPNIIPASSVQAAVRAFLFAPWSRTIPVLREMAGLLDESLAQERDIVPSEKRPLVFVLGTTLSEPGLMSAIEETGAWVVGDDLCTGSRAFEGEPPDRIEEADPLKRIAKRLMNKPPCPCKYSGPDNRINGIMERVKSAHAEGVILVRWKFCDPLGFELPDLSKKFKAAGYRVLEIELSGGGEVTQALRSRIEAFTETMKL